MIHTIINNSEFTKLLKENPNKFLIIKFSDIWCGPCKIMEPIYHNFSQHIETNKDTDNFNNLIMLQVEREKNRELIEQYQFIIPTIPSFFVCKINENGELESKTDIGGTQSMDRLLIQTKKLIQ